jgi:glucose/arabinose dehydrogenase
MRIEFSPLDASKAFVAEKGGVIKQVDITTGASSVLLDLSRQTNAAGDRGLMDIALHPNFAQNPYLYAFVTIDPAGTATRTGDAGADGAGNRYN